MKEYMRDLYYDKLRPLDKPQNVYHLTLNEAGQKRYANETCSMSLHRLSYPFRRFLLKYGIWSAR
jgi:hypothetical protein